MGDDTKTLIKHQLHTLPSHGMEPTITRAPPHVRCNVGGFFFIITLDGNSHLYATTHTHTHLRNWGPAQPYECLK
jgi:hypothetical protein